VGLDYSIAACSIGVSWPFWRLASSLRDLLGRLPARALLAQLPDAAGRRGASKEAELLVLRPENAVLPAGRPGPLSAG